MKTKEFIEMLQKADPSGEAHVRMDGGIPYYAEGKPGYYDGPYSYIDEDGNYTYSSAGTKVDIYTKDIFDFVDDIVSRNPDTTWEDVEKKDGPENPIEQIAPDVFGIGFVGTTLDSMMDDT